MMDSHKETEDENQEDKEHDKEFKEMYKGVKKRGKLSKRWRNNSRKSTKIYSEIFCVKGLVLSARMYVMVFQEQHTLPKWNILPLLIYEQAIRQNISLCEGVLVLEDHYIHMSRENKTFVPSPWTPT